jgi:uncharacterized repeat protein (TIGR03803 family)
MRFKKLFLILTLFISVLSNAQMSYYGVTSEGGSDNTGTIFKTDSTGGNLQTVFSFIHKNPGQDPQGRLVSDGAGNLYGVTLWGGSHFSNYGFNSQKSAGYIYKLIPGTGSSPDSMVVLHEFDITNGKWPNNSMIYHNGILYGTAWKGGSGGKGVLFSYNISTSVYTVLHHFQYTSSTHDGELPTGYLVLASNGKIYGTTEEGGANQYYGTIFSYNISSGTYAVEASFASGSGGNTPKGIVQGSDGNIYGINFQGAASGKGNIFRYNPSTHVLTARKDFYGIGAWGRIPMVSAGNDSLFGIINSGNYSTSYYNIFLYRPSLDSIAVLDTFMVSDVEGFNYHQSDNCIYGAYRSSGVNGYFKYDISAGSVTRIFSDTNRLNGRSYEEPVFVGNVLKGVASSGGLSNLGTVLEYNPATSTLTKKMDFYNPVYGEYPKGGLMMASNGKLYGLTYGGGAYNKGVLYEVNPSNNAVTVRLDLSNTLGYNPEGGVMQASDGNLYFLTKSGGTNGKGTLIQVNPQTWAAVKKLDMGGVYGENPSGTPEEAAGKLYFATTSGTSAYYGAIVEYNLSTGAAAAKYNFTGNSNVGFGVRGKLTLASDGYLYFITGDDFANYYSHGSISRFNPSTGSVTFRKSLFTYTGNYSYANFFTEDSAGKLWAVITDGGNNSEGTLISYDPVANTISVKIHLTQANGSNPRGGLLYASNGNFYGFTSLGGTNSYGTVFEYNTTQGAYVRKYSFDKTHGAYPLYGSLVEVSAMPIQITSQPSANTACIGDSAIITIAASHNSRLRYQWYKNGTLLQGATNDSLVFYPVSVLNNGTYVCKVSGSAATLTSSALSFTAHSFTVVDITAADSVFCAGDAQENLTVSPAGGNIYGQHVSGNSFSPDTAGSFPLAYVYTNTYGCTSYDTLVMTVNALPDASFTGLDASYCNNGMPDTLSPALAGGSFQLYAITGNVFYPDKILFPVGSTSENVNIIYSVTDNNNCSNSDTMTTTVYFRPDVNFGNLDTSFCTNDIPLLLSGAVPSGGTYSGRGVVGMTFDASIAGAGKDSLFYSYTDSHGCSNTDTAYTTVYAAPVISLPQDTQICINHKVKISTGLGQGYIFLWSNGSTDSVLTVDGAQLGTGAFVYAVTVTSVNGGCEETDSVKITVNACTGMTTAENDKNVKVYPNPSGGLFTIESTAGNGLIEVYSSTGRLVYSEKTESVNGRIDLRDKTPGVYYLLITTENKIIRKKLIIR